MFRQKEYSPIGPKPDPIDTDTRFISKNFDDVYENIKDFQSLKNELWTGINYSKFDQKFEQIHGKFYSNTDH